MLFRLIECIRGWLMPYPFWMRDLGRRGEYLARRHFHRRGYHCLARNWRCRGNPGELDVIMADSRQMLVLEVKTRHADEALRIGDTLRSDQKGRIRRLIDAYLRTWDTDQIPWVCMLVLVRYDARGKWRIESARVF